MSDALFDYHEIQNLRRAVEELTEVVENLVTEIGDWDPVYAMLELIPQITTATHRAEEGVDARQLHAVETEEP